MIDSVQDDLQRTIDKILTCPQTGSIIAITTITTSMGMNLDWIPDDIGKLATLIGIVLSMVLICSHLQNVKKIKLEIELLKKKQNKDDDG